MAKRYIRNYTVIQKNIKVGQSDKMINYLINQEHKNHKDTKIICQDNSEDFKDLLFLRKQKNDFNYMKNKKGGRKLSDIAKSITFNIPPAFEVSEEQSIEILDKIKIKMVELFELNNLDMDQSDLYAAIHFQENSHIHLILPMLDKNGKNMRRFKEPGFLIDLKILFTETVDNVCNTEIKEYNQLTPEERQHNATLKELQALKQDYEALYTSNDLSEHSKKIINKYLNKLNRTINHSDKPFEVDYINLINKDINSINQSKDIKKKFNPINI